jgi:serine/threonine protein phosphatase PrpC
MDLGAVTHPGSVRPDNEDGYFATREHGVFAVADGMGGHAHGEVASHLALDAIADRAAALADAAPSELPVALHDAIQAANTQIFAQAEAEDLRDRMGTTLVVATVCDDRLYFAHIGDSRLYLLRGDALSQLTRDHSLVQSMVDRGEITLEEAALHPLRHQITRVVGGDNYVSPEIASQALEAGDVLLLCTDGLPGALPADGIKAALATAGTAQERAQHLVDAALDAGASDNVTALVVVYDRPRLTTPQPAPEAPRPRHILPLWQSVFITVLVLAIGAVGFGIWAYLHPDYYVGTLDGKLSLYEHWTLLPLQDKPVLTPEVPPVNVAEAKPVLDTRHDDLEKGIAVRDKATGIYMLKDIAGKITSAVLIEAKKAIDEGNLQLAHSQLERARAMGADETPLRELTKQLEAAKLHPKPKPPAPGTK